MQSFGKDISDKTSTLNNAIDYQINLKITLWTKILLKKKKIGKELIAVSAEELLKGIINIFESGIFMIRSKSVYDFDDDCYFYFLMS